MGEGASRVRYQKGILRFPVLQLCRVSNLFGINKTGLYAPLDRQGLSGWRFRDNCAQLCLHPVITACWTAGSPGFSPSSCVRTTSKESFWLTLQQFSLFNPPDILTVREKAHGARTYSAEVTRRGVTPQAAIYGFIAACFLRKVHTAPIAGLYRIQHFLRFVKGPSPVFLHKILLPQPFSGVRSVQSGHFRRRLQ